MVTSNAAHRKKTDTPESAGEALAELLKNASKFFFGSQFYKIPESEPQRIDRAGVILTALESIGNGWRCETDRIIAAEAKQSIINDGIVPSLTVLADRLRANRQYEAANFCIELTKEFFSAADIDHWAKKYATLVTTANIVRASKNVLQEIGDGKGPDDPGLKLAISEFNDAVAGVGVEHIPELKTVSIADVFENPELEQQWVIDGLVPSGTVTNLAGHGGTGKTLLLMEAAAHVVMGLPFLGRNVMRGHVVYFSAEDGSAMIRRRQGPICATFGFDPAAVAEGLTIIDAQDIPTLYAVEESKYGTLGNTTPTYTALKALVAKIKPVLLIIDNASDCFDGNENERRAVRAFVRSLVAAVKDFGGAVILLLHTNKISAKGKEKSTENYSGSTAWHNSARSRLALMRDDDAGEGRSVLVHEKCNVGPLSAPILLQYSDGVIRQAYDDSASIMGSETILLGMVAEFNSRNEYLYVNARSPGNAFKVLSGEPDFPKRMARGAFDAAMRSLQRKGHVQVSSEKNFQRRIIEVWRVTPAGMAATQQGVSHAV